MPVADLKPRFLRYLQTSHPDNAFATGDLICISHLKDTLHSRVDALLEADGTELAQFQDDVMRNLENFELGEEHWKGIHFRFSYLVRWETNVS